MSDAQVGRLPAERAVHIVFGIAVVATFVYALWVTRHYYFWVDDWRLVSQSGSVGGIVGDYNGHLSVVILGIYRVLIEIFGFSYLPFRVVGLVCLLAVPVSYYLTNRRQMSPALAALLGLSLLAGENISFLALELNHYLALVGGIGCASALNRGRRGDPWLAAGLALSLAAAGGGLAVAVACIAHNLCVRAPLRRWVAVVGPVALWTAWWLPIGRDYDTGGFHVTTTQAVHVTWDLLVASFASLGMHNPLFGILLMAAYLGYGVGCVRQGLDFAANWLGWTSALAFWGVGLAFGRGAEVDPHSFRYQLLAIGFVLLAIVPRRRVTLPRWIPRGVDPRWAAVAVVLGVGLQARGLETEQREPSQIISRSSTLNHGRVIVLGIEPEVVADDVQLPLDMGVLPAGEVRSLLERYGGPIPRGGDAALVRAGVVLSTPASGEGPVECASLSHSFLQPIASTGLRLWPREMNVEVEVRRFGTEWVPVDEARPGEFLIVRLPALDSEIPWEVRAKGSCRVGRP